MKPIFFTFVVWGEVHGRYFLDYCLPSMLSPNNLPALKLSRKNEIVLCVDRVLWKKITETRIYQTALQFVSFKTFFIEPGKSASANDHHRYYMKYISPYLKKQKVYACQLNPDVIVADGSFKKLEELVEQGFQVILGQTPLRTNPSVLDAILAREIIPQDSFPLSQSGRPLVISTRQAIDLTLDHLHFEAKGWQWGQEMCHMIPIGFWWKVPRSRAYIMHSLNWMRYALDYGVVEKIVGMGSVEEGKVDYLDGYYLQRHFNKVPKEKIYIIKDSDDCMIINWCDYSVGLEVPKSPELRSWFWGFRFRILCMQRLYLDKGVVCDFKRSHFQCQTIAHADNNKITSWLFVSIVARFIVFCIKSQSICKVLEKSVVIRRGINYLHGIPKRICKKIYSYLSE